MVLLCSIRAQHLGQLSVYWSLGRACLWDFVYSNHNIIIMQAEKEKDRIIHPNGLQVFNFAQGMMPRST
jgi:hypothetical protein